MKNILISIISLALIASCSSKKPPKSKPQSPVIGEIESPGGDKNISPLDAFKLQAEKFATKEDVRQPLSELLKAIGIGDQASKDIIDVFMSSNLLANDAVSYATSVFYYLDTVRLSETDPLASHHVTDEVFSKLVKSIALSSESPQEVLASLATLDKVAATLKAALASGDAATIDQLKHVIENASKMSPAMALSFIELLSETNTADERKGLVGLSEIALVSTSLDAEGLSKAMASPSTRSEILAIANTFEKLKTSGVDVGDIATTGSWVQKIESAINSNVTSPSAWAAQKAAFEQEVKASILALDTTAPSKPALSLLAAELEYPSPLEITLSQAPAVNDFDKFSYRVCSTGDCSLCSATESFSTTGNLSISGLSLSDSVKICAQSMDLSGNRSEFSESTVITVVDHTAPLITIDAPDRDSSGNFAAVTVSAPRSLTTVTTGADTLSWSVFSKPTGASAAISTPSLESTAVNFDLDGVYVFRLTASDLSGNVSTKDFSLTYDSPAPSISLGSLGSVNIANSASYLIGGLCSAIDQTVSIEASTVTSSAPCTSLGFSKSLDLSGLSDGSITLTVSLTSVGGKTSTDSISLTKDSLAPAVSFSGTPASIVNTGDFEVTVGTSDGATHYQYGVASGSVSCSAVTMSSSIAIATPISGSLSDGIYTLCAVGVDAAGNKTAIGSAARSVWTVDTTSPDLTLSAPSLVNAAAAGIATISGTCSEEGDSISIAVGSVNDTALCTSGAYSKAVDISSLSDGTHSVSVSSTDLALHTTSKTGTVVKDSLVPTAGFDFTQKVNLSNQAAFLISGACNKADATITVTIASTPHTAVCDGSSYSITVDLSAKADGALTAVVAASDASSNSSSTSGTLNKKVTQPSVTLSSAAFSSPTIYDSSITISVVFSEAVTGFELSDVSVSSGAVSALTGSGASYSMTFTPSAGSAAVTISVPASKAIDTFSNANTASNSVTKTFNPDLSSPVAGDSGRIFVRPEYTKANVNFTHASDDTTDQATLNYSFYISASASMDSVTDIETNGTLAATKTNIVLYRTGGVKGYVRLSSLTEGSTYYANIIATDRVGKKTAFTKTKFKTMKKNLSFTKVKSSYGFSCGLTVGGSLYCWGSNDSGQLGNGTTTNSAIPVKTSDTGKIKDFGLGLSWACALYTNNSVSCWGKNDTGALGINDASNSTIRTSPSTPITNPAGVTKFSVKSLSVGAYVMCVVADADSLSGQIYCWGDGRQGQLGQGGTTAGPALASSPRPIKVVASAAATSYVDVLVSNYYACAISFGTRIVECWGSLEGIAVGIPHAVTDNSQYDCDTGAWQSPCVEKPTALQPATGGKIIRARSLGKTYNNMFALTLDGEVYAVGGIGLETGSDAGDYLTVPTSITKDNIPAGAKAVEVAQSSGYSTCITYDNGKVYCVGFNMSDEFQMGNTDDLQFATEVPMLSSDFTSINTGYYAYFKNICGVRRSTGLIECNGPNYSLYGNGASSVSLAFVNPTISGTPAFGFKKMSVGANISCGISNDSRLFCSGKNDRGLLGIGVSGTSVYASNPSLADHNKFMPVASSESFIDVSVSAGNVCAVSIKNQMYCWGSYNGDGVSITGSNAVLDSEHNAPKAISSTIRFLSVVTGGLPSDPEHSKVCGVATDGKVYCMGYNGGGAIAQEYAYDVWSMAQVQADASASSFQPTQNLSVDLGGSFICINSAGAIFCGGDDTNYQSGGYGSQNKLWAKNPFTLPTNKAVEQLSLGSDHGCALSATGDAYCWGAYSAGALGNSSLSSDVQGYSLVTLPAGNKVFSLKSSHIGKSSYFSLADNSIYVTGENDYGQLGLGTVTAKKTAPEIMTLGSPTATVGIYPGASSYIQLEQAGTVSLKMSSIGRNSNGQLGLDSTTNQSASFATSLFSYFE
ncbi:MAG: hypothetical protein EOP06_00880 [Proteobacteria bacterium]|nr:MAG: hypothetical protein EOP06_00880 [Pseudomonadota bacterium]